MASIIFQTLSLLVAVGGVFSGPFKTCALDKGKCDTDKYVTCGEVTVKNGWISTTTTVNVESLDEAAFKKSRLSVCTKDNISSESEVINADSDTGFGICHHTCERNGKTETINCVKGFAGFWYPYRAKTNLLVADLPGGNGTSTQMMYTVLRGQMTKNAQADKNAETDKKGECK